MKIGIIGAGFTGLSAGYFLSQKGHQVTIFEKEKYPGGLAAGFLKKGWDWYLEYFFHHLFTSDIATKNLIAELGLTNKLFYRRPKTSIYFERQRETSSAYFKGKISQFDSPISILTFPHLSLLEKLRTGLVTACLKLKTPRMVAGWIPSVAREEAITPPRWKKIKKLKMLGALNLILVLKEPFLTDGTYWLNINEPNFPFVAVVEHTNFIDPKYYGGNHLLYVGGYYSQNHRYFKMEKEEILNEFLPYLKKINPNYQLLITNYYLFKSLFAQPIIPINYSKIIPPHQTPIPNIFLANMQQIYP